MLFICQHFPSAQRDQNRLRLILEIRNIHTPIVHNGHISDRKLFALFDHVERVIKLCQDDPDDMSYLSILEDHLKCAIISKYQHRKVPSFIFFLLRMLINSD